MRFLRLALVLALALPSVALAQQPQEPPVGVVPMPTGEVPPEIVMPVRDAVVTALQPHVEGRMVLPMADEQRLIAILQCPDAACIGAQLAEAGAVAGVLVRISREDDRDPVMVTLEVVDPVSGAARIEPVQVEIATDQIESAAELVAQQVPRLADAMPEPPPASSLLVAVNVDEATVAVDGEQVGTSPVGAVEVEPGRHVVDVTRDGFSDARSSIEVGRGEDARLDVRLDPSPGNVALLEQDAALGAEDGVAAGPADPWYTRWYVIAGAGAVVAAVIVGVIVAVAASGDDTPDAQGIPIPPIE